MANEEKSSSAGKDEVLLKGLRVRVKAKRTYGVTNEEFEAVELPAGPHLFVDWRFVQPGHLNWVSKESGEPYEMRLPHLDGPLDAEAIPVNMPEGIRIRAQKAWKSDPFPLEDDGPDDLATRLSRPGPGITILQHEGRYLSWRGSIHEKITCLESEDGWDWKKKDDCVLDLSAAPEIQQPFGSYGIFIDPSAPDAERFKMIFRNNQRAPFPEDFRKKIMDEFLRDRPDDIGPYIGKKRNADTPEKLMIMYGAVSPDGIRWKANKGPLIIQFSDTINTVHYDEDLRKYVWYSRNNWYFGRRCVGRSESDTFRRFPAPETIVLPGPEDLPTDDWYTNSKTVYPGTSSYHFLFPAKYNRLSEGCGIHLFSSPDGIVWARVPDGTVLDMGSPGSWDGACVMGGYHLVPLDGDKVGLPYVGNPYPHKYPRTRHTFKSRIAFALWQKERISALEAPESGQFTTFTFIPPGSRLRLNHRTLHSGFVRIEVADKKGNVLSGRSFADCLALSGDSTDDTVRWAGGETLGNGRDQPIMLRFRLKETKLFAFEITAV